MPQSPDAQNRLVSGRGYVLGAIIKGALLTSFAAPDQTRSAADPGASGGASGRRKRTRRFQRRSAARAGQSLDLVELRLDGEIAVVEQHVPADAVVVEPHAELVIGLFGLAAGR